MVQHSCLGKALDNFPGDSVAAAGLEPGNGGRPHQLKFNDLDGGCGDFRGALLFSRHRVDHTNWTVFRQPIWLVDNQQRALRYNQHLTAARRDWKTMLPTPIPLAPLVIILGLASVVLIYAGIKAFLGFTRMEPDETAVEARRARFRQARISALAIGGTALLLAAGCLIFLTAAMTTHEARYSQAMWGALAQNYDVHPLDAGSSFEPGQTFQATVGGEAADCKVSPPELVVCNGAEVPPVAG